MSHPVIGSPDNVHLMQSCYCTELCSGQSHQTEPCLCQTKVPNVILKEKIIIMSPVNLTLAQWFIDMIRSK